MNIIDTILATLGITYVFLWSIGFYFQAYLIYKLRYAGGYSIDFQILNILGYAFLIANNLNFVIENNGSYDSIIDLVFPVHAFLITSFILCLSFRYPRGINQGNLSVYLIIFVMLLMIAIYHPVSCKFGTCNFHDIWIFMGLTKVLVSITKNTYQVFLNKDQQSTYGFSMAAIALDFGDAFLSLVQIALLIVYKYHDNLTNQVNWPRVILAVQAMIFDIVFFVQNCIYRRRRIALGALGLPKKPQKVDYELMDFSDESS